MILTRPGEFLNEIKNDRIILEDAKKKVKHFESKLNKIRKRDNKFEKQKKHQLILITFTVLKNIIFDSSKDFTTMGSEAKIQIKRSK